MFKELNFPITQEKSRFQIVKIYTTTHGNKHYYIITPTVVATTTTTTTKNSELFSHQEKETQTIYLHCAAPSPQTHTHTYAMSIGSLFYLTHISCHVFHLGDCINASNSVDCPHAHYSSYLNHQDNSVEVRRTESRKLETSGTFGREEKIRCV